ncbi:MAG: HAD-IIIA family hydrolase [Candidatus Eisenbacteria bacterium]|nr:HAD-IIIA family hydrolase [Candidatus Latescibacterota bacterium]MBD3301824.1 HAD-IIIA family hydrolase [Candidatus Eisenbacteria bacterium]
MSGRPAVFFDRDGTLLELVPYLHRPEQVRLTAGAGDALRRLGERGWLRVLVTNQSGIARGLFDRDQLEAVHERMRALLRAEGGGIDAIEVCPHHPDFTGACTCRKPRPGMLERAGRKLGVDPVRSWMIGDRFEDLEAGRRFGARGILVLTGYGREQARAAGEENWEGVACVARDFASAAAAILGGLPDARA